MRCNECQAMHVIHIFPAVEAKSISQVLQAKLGPDIVDGAAKIIAQKEALERLCRALREGTESAPQLSRRSDEEKMSQI